MSSRISGYVTQSSAWQRRSWRASFEDYCRRRDLSQADAAGMLGIAQPDVSDLVRGRLARFSMERLERFLLALGMDIRIQIAPRRRANRRGALTVEVVGAA